MDLQCRIADLNIEFELNFERTYNDLSKYAHTFYSFDERIEITSGDFDLERKVALKETKILLHDKSLEITAAFRKLAEKLPLYDGVVLHSCSFKANGKGIAFGAYSGTGKTTHMLLWQELLGDKMTIINGDKPIVRFIDDELYIYGTPWAGKEGLQNNIKAPLTDICEIVRSETNFTTKMSRSDGIELLYRQFYMPFNAETRIKTLELINQVAEKVNFWKIHCNMDISAAEVAYNTIFGGK